MIKDVVNEILPPMTRIARYRLVNSLFMLAFLFHIVWACGALPGLPGFAKAADVSQIGRDLMSIKLNLLEQQLFQVRCRQCDAITAQNKDAMKFWGEKLSDLRLEYRGLAGGDYVLPACSEL